MSLPVQIPQTNFLKKSINQILTGLNGIFSITWNSPNAKNLTFNGQNNTQGDITHVNNLIYINDKSILDNMREYIIYNGCRIVFGNIIATTINKLIRKVSGNITFYLTFNNNTTLVNDLDAGADGAIYKIGSGVFTPTGTITARNFGVGRGRDFNVLGGGIILNYATQDPKIASIRQLWAGYGGVYNYGNGGTITFQNNDNQLSPLCVFTGGGQRYGGASYINLNGTNQECAGISNVAYGSSPTTGFRVRNGHASAPATLTINTDTADVTADGNHYSVVYRGVENGGAAVLNVIKKGRFNQQMCNSTNGTLLFTGFLDVQQGQFRVRDLSTNDIRITIDAAAPTSTSGSANSGYLYMSIPAPNLSAKVFSLTCNPTATFSYIFFMYLGGGVQPNQFNVNGTARLLNEVFTLGVFTNCTITATATQFRINIA